MYAALPFSRNWLVLRATNRLVLRHVPNLGGVVLDLGVGARPFGPEISRVSDLHVGVDWMNSPHRPLVDVFADLGHSLPFSSNSVDHVVLLEVLEHVPEPGALLVEVCRVLRTDGTLLLSVPFQWWEHEAPWDYHRFTRYGLAYHIRNAGLELEWLEPKTGAWGTLALKLSYKVHEVATFRSRLASKVARAIWAPIGFACQAAGGALDKAWPDLREAAGYVLVARKP